MSFDQMNQFGDKPENVHPFQKPFKTCIKVETPCAILKAQRKHLHGNRCGNTKMIEYELAQLNIALMPYPFESPYMKDFVDNLDRINLLAEDSDGFVWRLQTEDGSATDKLPFGDEYLVNISVWRDIDALRSFVFSSRHVEIMRRRSEWFTSYNTEYSTGEVVLTEQ